MSGTENEAVEAVEAGARVLAARAGFDLDDLQRHARPGEDVAAWRANWITSAREVYDAMRGPIAQEVIASVCRREGHDRLDTTPLDSAEREIRCRRCGEIWNEPRPKPKLAERWAFIAPAPSPCPFGCGTGPLGRDKLNAHLAECPEAQVMQERINGLIRRVDEHEAYAEDSAREMFGDYPRSEK